MENKWVVRSDQFAGWSATIPTEDRHTLVAAARAIADVGEECRVHRVLRTDGDTSYDEVRDGRYSDWMRRIYLETGNLPFFSRGISSSVCGTICVSSHDLVHEVETTDVGQLLRSVRPAIQGRVYTAPGPPIELLGGTVEAHDDRPVWLSVWLRTDVWFPRVRGWAEEDVSDLWFDNRALAQCHTPRLNEFLARTAEIVGAVGGVWELEDPQGAAEPYADMVGITGILMNSQ